MSRPARGVRACLVLSALPLLAMALGTGCSRQGRMRAQRVPVTVARVEVRPVPYEIATNGTVEARQTAGINAQVGGVVLRIAFREGDEVAAGQLLVQIDPKPFQAARLQAERAAKLVVDNYISQDEADTKRAAAEALHATVRADSAAAATAALNLDYAAVRAPFAGRTGNLHVHVGDLIKANDTGNPMVTLNQVRPILVRFTIPERELPQVLAHRSEGLRVDVHAGGSDTVLESGSLAFMDNAVDPATGTLLMKGEFQNRDGALWPGQFVDTRLVVYVEKNACVVPQPAITTLPAGAFVYVLQPDTTVAIRPVKVTRTARNLAVISTGLKPGETVVTDGQLRLSQGSRVMIRDGRQLGLEAVR